MTTIEATLRAKRSRTPLLRAAALGALIVGLDQLAKRTIADGIAAGQTQKFLPAINFVHVRNSGVAFGFFAGGGIVVLAFTLAALALLLGYFLLHPERRGLWVPTGMLLGGAIGNLVDRLANGAVTDFIKLPAWPAFNVADMSITFGVLALLYVLEGGRGSAD